MFKLNGKKISIDRDLTIGEGADAITYPIASLHNAATRAAIGIVEASDPERPDDRRYWVSENEDGTYFATLKDDALANEAAGLVKQIDADADSIYSAALGHRATEYAQAEAEAQAYKEGGYSASAVPDYVLAWATATGNTAQWAADDILSTAAAWRTAQTAIRSSRLACKEAVRKAADFDSLEAAKDAWQAASQAIRAQLGL